MAKDIKRHLSHLKGSGGTAPSSSDILYGEIAVGYKAGEEALYIKNSDGDIVTITTQEGSQALSELYTDQHVISKVTGDTEISVSLSNIDTTSDTGRTLTITHASGSAQSGFKKLASDSYGHITGGSNVALSDLTGLGALSGITGEQGISAGTRSNGNQKIGHTNIITAGSAQGSSGEIAHKGSFNIPKIDYDSNGHITSTGVTTVTLPENDNYISDIVASNSGISLNVTDRVLKAGHTNSIAAGSAKTSSSSVTVIPDGNNITIPIIEYNVHGHITKTGTTDVSLKVNTATTDTAGVVKIATTTGNNNSNVVMTQSAVTQAINDSFAAQDAMVYKGLVGNGNNYGFPTTFSKGYTYKVGASFTASGVTYEIGDMFIANVDITTAENFTPGHWDAIQTNLDPTLYVNTATTVTGAGALENGGNLSTNRTITHKELAPSGAAGTTSPSAAQAPGFGETFNVPVINYDKYGHITGKTTTTVTIPASASSWTNNYYITGASTTTATDKFDVALRGNNTAAKASFTIPSATTTAAGVMTSSDKTKLNGIATGAEVNQNAFSNVKVGSTTIEADGKTDTLELSAATFVVLTPDATNDKVTIGVSTGTTNSTLSRGDHDHDGIYQPVGNYVQISRKVSTASGLTGGGDLSADRTIGLAATGTSGTYGPSADVTGTEGTTIKIPQITTDAYGRVTSVTERTLTNKNSTYTVNNGTFTVSGNGVSVASTSANASANTGVNIKAGSDISITTGTSEITIKGNYTFDGTYNASSNKAATVSSVTSRISAISGSSTGSSSKTITAISQSNGVVTPTYANISITKSQVSDFAHNQASNTITAMTSYSKPSSTSAIATGDTLNAAVGKLEKGLDTKANASDLDGIKLKKITQSAYDALTTKDPNTLYIIIN